MKPLEDWITRQAVGWMAGLLGRTLCKVEAPTVTATVDLGRSLDFKQLLWPTVIGLLRNETKRRKLVSIIGKIVRRM